jgi:DNA-binding TFAR19-related protein (PDSD5 family)
MAATAAGTTEPRTTESREPREQEKSSKSQIVIVDLDEPQSSRLVTRLRKGKGKLVTKVDRIISDLVEAGTIKSTAQLVVLVVREIPLGFFGEEDDY